MSEPKSVVHRKRGGPKKVKDYELTLSRSSLEKTHVFLALEEFCELLIVSQEEHEDSGDGVLRPTHFHCYMRLHEPDRIVGVREWVGLNLFGDEVQAQESIHLSTLRNAKHWIKYITKEDPYPMVKNVDSGLFHQSWKIHNYIRNHEVINGMDPFIRQNPSLLNILTRMHTEYWNGRRHERHCETIRRRPVQPNYAVDWVRQAGETLCQHKNLYLFGHTGVGKTVLVNYLTTGNCGTVFLPCGTSNWEFGDLTSQTAYAVAGDSPLDYLLQHRSTILRLLDKDPTPLNVKCGQFKTVIFEGIFVVVSNFPPPEDPALRRRFVIIHADCNGVQEVKPEVETIQEDIPEVIEVSSDEEIRESISSDEEWSGDGQQVHGEGQPIDRDGQVQWGRGHGQHGDYCEFD